ncbi:MAG: hypothetical protein ACI4JB_08115 [Porcipelethomonas sp.]
MAKRSILDRYTASQKYIVARGRALTFPPNPFKVELTDKQVYGIVIDIPMSPTVLATMVCFINGSANLYFNLGGEFVNASARYRGVAQAAYDFVKNASGYLGCCEKTTKFDMPTAGKNYVHFLTKSGVYKTVIVPNAIPADDNDRKKINFFTQRVMSELRTAQLKDQAAGIGPGFVTVD